MLYTEIKVNFDELTEAEIEQCVESWYSIREYEEGRAGNEINNDYPEVRPDKNTVRELLKCSKGLYKNTETGYIFVDI